MKIPVDKILALNDTIIYYEQMQDELIVKLRATKAYSREESDYITKIRSIDRWIKNIKLTKERLYDSSTN
jgi:hypothetical protein